LTLVKEARLSVVTGQFARALILLLVCTAQTAHAQVTVDVSKITCEQFIVLPKADSIAIWLGGYYNGDRHISVIDVNRFEESARNLRAACRIPDNFKRPIMQLIESIIPK
jgi:hypothetical protein